MNWHTEFSWLTCVHNKRIERLWREVFVHVLQLYYSIFYFLEDNFELDCLSDIDLFTRNYVFVPIIDRAVTDFVEACVTWLRDI